MRHSKLILFSLFSLAVILMIGCGENQPKKRARITRGGVSKTGGANEAQVIAAQFKGGASVPSAESEIMDAARIDQILQQKTGGAKRISLESLRIGSYQLTEVINVGRKIKASKNKETGLNIEGHSAKIEVDQNGTIHLHALNPFATKSAPVNSQGRPFNVAVHFEVLKEDLKVHSAIAYLSKVINGKRVTNAIAGNLNEDNLVVELKAARAKLNKDNVYVIRQDQDGSELITVFEKAEELILSKDIQKTQGDTQQVISSLLIYKRIDSEASKAGSAGSDSGSAAAAGATTSAVAGAATIVTDNAAAAKIATGTTTGAGSTTTTATPSAAELTAAIAAGSAVLSKPGSASTSATTISTDIQSETKATKDSKETNEEPTVRPLDF